MALKGHGKKARSQEGGSGNAASRVHRGENAARSRCPARNGKDPCGACTGIDTSYAEQLAAKDACVAALFAGIASEGAEIRPIIGMENPFNYRNKITSPFAYAKGPRGRTGCAQGVKRPGGQGSRSQHGKREILTGMYAPGTHRIVRTGACLLEDERGAQVVEAVRAIMMRHDIAPYDEDRHAGFIRHVVVRVGRASGEVLVTVVTNGDEFPSSKGFCRELVKRCPFVTSVVQNVNTRQTNAILGQTSKRLYGPGFILDTLCGLSFRISAGSFYQVNAEQAAVLYETAIGLAELGPQSRVLDAYCGTGTIGLIAAARSGAEVLGVESVEAAVRDARENARHNGIENTRFVAADASAFLREAAAANERFDTVFLDPPRAGSTPEFLAALSELAPARIVYISCNPETQVRDIEQLAQAGYRTRVVQPVDMFPHTEHIECIALIERDGVG